jgi:hypothetical protein
MRRSYRFVGWPIVGPKQYFGRGNLRLCLNKSQQFVVNVDLSSIHANRASSERVIAR